MTRTILLYGKINTTSLIFMRALKRLVTRYGDEVRDCRFHIVFDDRRNRDEAAALLAGHEQVTLHAHYEECDPHDASAAWPLEQVQEWERRYGEPHLRRFIAAERIMEGRPDGERWRWLLHHVAYYERLHRELRPSLFVSGPPNIYSSWLAITMFQRSGVPSLIVAPGRLGDRCFTPADPYERLDIGALYREKLRDGLLEDERREAEALIRQYRDRGAKPVEFSTVQATTRIRPLPRLTRLWQLFRDSRWADYRYYEDPFRLVVPRALKARRTVFYDAVLRRRALRRIPDEPKFFFFPLQFEPEMSVITNGRGWTDQLELIRLISLCLPIDRWLYVKEHPMMVSGVRPWRFYRELLKLPRVRLIDQRMDSSAVIPKAEAVITLGSTAGLEALTWGKPVVLAGRAFYEEFPEGVFRLDDPEALPGLLRWLRDHRVSQDALTAFVAAALTRAPRLLFTGFPGFADRELAEDNVDRLARLILERIQALEDVPQPAGGTR